MKIHQLSEHNSILNNFLAQIRDVSVQKDSMRFRKNLERIGEIMAYELSKSLAYQEVKITTPLGIKNTESICYPVVLCSILRAGLALHQGFMNYFDEAENGFISAYRHHVSSTEEFEILVEYKATPFFDKKNVIFIDPMLATGKSVVAVLQKLLQDKSSLITAKEVHIVVVIASPEGIKYLEENVPNHYHLWIASLDEKLNEKNYIIPGLGDAGDLAYGIKL